jgi:hypothetical protein
MLLIYICFVVRKQMRKSHLRNQFFQQRSTARCALCDIVDDVRYFDVDHKVGLRFGGPNEPWNLWSLCLRHHRDKTAIEHLLAKQLAEETLCWSCLRVQSKYFEWHVFCKDCRYSSERIDRLETNLRRWLVCAPHQGVD